MTGHNPILYFLISGRISWIGSWDMIANYFWFMLHICIMSNWNHPASVIYWYFACNSNLYVILVQWQVIIQYFFILLSEGTSWIGCWDKIAKYFWFMLHICIRDNWSNWGELIATSLTYEWLPSCIIMDRIVVRKQYMTKWLTKLVNSMNETLFSILFETEWCHFVHNTNRELVATSLICITTFVP